MHILCCIEEKIKECLQTIELDATVVCDKTYCWCPPQDLNPKLCGINIYIDSETILETSRTIGGNYRCGLGVLDAEINFIIEIYAIACDDARYNAKNCLALVNRALCIHHDTIPVVELQYNGFRMNTDQMGEYQATVIVADYVAKYRIDLCKPNASRISCAKLN